MQAIFELIGIIFDSDYSDMFLHAENDETIIELRDHTIITELILPLCGVTCFNFVSASKWLFAKLVFANNPARLSAIVLENNKGECVAYEVGKPILQDLSKKRKDGLYITLCQYIIDDVSLVLSLM